MYFYQIFDWYSASLTFIMVGFLEVVVVMFVYGQGRFCQDAQLMFGFKPSWPIRIIWLTFTPIILGLVMTFGMALMDTPYYEYRGKYEYPKVTILN